MSIIKTATGSDSYILSATATDKAITIQNPNGKEFKLTITIRWEEYRQAGQPAGSLWFGSTLGKQTPALPSIRADFQIAPISTTPLTIVTLGGADVHYTGQANAHVWLSYFAEFAE
jgi:hypothetical protein